MKQMNPSSERPMRTTAREKRDYHAARAGKLPEQIKRARENRDRRLARVEKLRAAGKDTTDAEEKLAKAEKTLAARQLAYPLHRKLAAKLLPAAHRADAALKGIKPPQHRTEARVLTKAEHRAAEKARERHERDEAERIRQQRSVGLTADPMTAAGRRDFEINDTTRQDPKKGVRQARQQSAQRLFEDHRRHWTYERELAIKAFDVLWHASQGEEGIAPQSMMPKVDRSTGPAGPPLRAVSSMDLRDVRAAIGHRGVSLLVRRIVIGATWEQIAADRGETRRAAGSAFVEALDGVIRVLGIAPPQEQSRIRVDLTPDEQAARSGKDAA